MNEPTHREVVVLNAALWSCARRSGRPTCTRLARATLRERRLRVRNLAFESRSGRPKHHCSKNLFFGFSSF